MTTLTIEETLKFRAIKRTGIVLMLMLRLNKPVGESDIAALLDMAPKTARIQLRSLAAIGLVTRVCHHQGWTLTGIGRHLVLPMTQLEEVAESAETEDVESQLEHPSEIDEICHLSQNHPVEPVKVTGSAIINIKDKDIKDSESLNINSEPVKMTGLHPPSEMEDCENVQNIREPDPDELAIIKDLEQRGIMLNKRTSRLLGKIKREDIENVWTQLSWDGKEWETGLMVFMLEQVAASKDLARPAYDENGRVINHFQVLEANMRNRADFSKTRAFLEEQPPPDVPPELPVEVLAAWEAAQPGLRAAFSEAEYDTWVRDLIPAGCEGDCMVFDPLNDYARDWLAARRDAIERCLGLKIRFR